MVNIRQITDISSGFDLEKVIKKFQERIDYTVDKTGNYYTILSERLKEVIWPGDYLNYAESIVAIDREGKINSWRFAKQNPTDINENERKILLVSSESMSLEKDYNNSEREKVLWNDSREVEKHFRSLSEFQEKKRWMETVLEETENEFHGKCDYRNGWSKEKQIASVKESIAGWERKIQEERDWLIYNDTQQRNQIGEKEKGGLMIVKEHSDSNINYNNWTKNQLISEINKLKTEIESLKTNPTLTNSEKQTKIQQNQQQLAQLNNYYSNSVSQPNNSSSSKSNLPTNLAIGGTALALVGLVSILAIRKTAKIKK